MNFIGFLWVVSAIGSFWSPQDLPRFLEHFGKAVRSRNTFLASQAVRPKSWFYFSAQSTTSAQNSRVSKASPGIASRLWSPTLTSFIESSPGSVQASASERITSARTPTIAHLAIQPISPGSLLSFSTETLPLSVPQLIGHWFRRTGDIRAAFRFAAPSIAVVPAPNPCAAFTGSEAAAWSRWTYRSNDGLKALTLGKCTELWRNDATLPLPMDTVFQVRVKGYPVAEVPTQDDAEKIARQLDQVLRHPEFTPHSLTPAMMAGTPMGKAGDTILFAIAPEWADLLDRNPELMAIDWINRLRMVLNVPALPLVEAQSQMHGLVPTLQQIKGTASWYGPYFHGRLTATGEIFDQHQLTAAHPSLPFNTYLKVTNLLTQQAVIVRINDRGPYFEDRSLDLSQEAARSLGSELKGVVPYEAVVMQKADLSQLQPSWTVPRSVALQRNQAKQLLARY